MKKIVIWIIVLAIAAFAVDKLLFSKKTGPLTETPRQPALSASKNSAAFNVSFEKMLNGYFALKEALADYDTARSNSAAVELAGFAEGIKMDEIKGDSTGDIRKTAGDFAGAISTAAKELPSQPDLIKKKRSFSTISEALYNLVRTVRYDRQTLYHQHCPMAFNDEEEAWWISNSNKIDNPYLGRKHPKYKASMEGCGDITDSLNFSK